MSRLVVHAAFGVIFAALCGSVVFSQCTHIMNDVCYIDADSAASSETLQCGMSKCVVSCASELSCADKQIICDLSAESCIIHCSATQSCRGTKITATTSQYTAIIVDGGTAAATRMSVDAPGSNGGELYINVSNSDFYSNTIQSQSASAAITVNCNSANACHNNTINGRAVQNAITFLCDGVNVDCSNSKIYCSDSISSQCYMHCSSCPNTHMFSSQGLSSINWHCRNQYSCTDSSVHCVEPETQKVSDLVFDVEQSQWHYTYPRLCQNADNSTANGQGSTINATTTSTLSAISDMEDEEERDTEWSWLHADMQSVYTIIGLIFLSLCCVKCIIAYWMYSHHQLEIDLMDKGVRTSADLAMDSRQMFASEPSNDSDIVALTVPVPAQVPAHQHFQGDHEEYSISLRAAGEANLTSTLPQDIQMNCHLNMYSHENNDMHMGNDRSYVGRKSSQSKAYNIRRPRIRTHALQKSNSCPLQFSRPEHIHYIDETKELESLPFAQTGQAQSVQLAHIEDEDEDGDYGVVDDDDEHEQSALILNMQDFVASQRLSESALMTVRERSRTRPKLSSSLDRWTEPPGSDSLVPVSMRAVFNCSKLRNSRTWTQTRTRTWTMTEGMAKSYSSIDHPSSMKVNAPSQSNLLALNIPIPILNGLSSMETNMSNHSVDSTTTTRAPDAEHRSDGNIFNIPVSLQVTAPTSTRSFSNGSSVQPLHDHGTDTQEEEEDRDADVGDYDDGTGSKTRRQSTTRSLPKRLSVRNKQTMSVPVSVSASQSSLTTDTSVSSEETAMSVRKLSSNLSINASLQIDTIQEDQLYFDKISEFRHIHGYHNCMSHK